ncbi:MAG: lipoate-protein ligase B, partial [Chloroflexota bacterium]
LNVATDLSMFQNIIPCGMPELPASSIEDQIGNVIGLPQVAKVTAEILGVALGSRIEWTNSIELIN